METKEQTQCDISGAWNALGSELQQRISNRNRFINFLSAYCKVGKEITREALDFFEHETDLIVSIDSPADS